jgi:hypothetical protein
MKQEKYTSIIKQAVVDWNDANPTLRKKTMDSTAKEVGVTSSALIQMEETNQFQKHAAVILNCKSKKKQVECFETFKQLDIPLINKWKKICEYLECEI